MELPETFSGEFRGYLLNFIVLMAAVTCTVIINQIMSKIISRRHALVRTAPVYMTASNDAPSGSDVSNPCRSDVISPIDSNSLAANISRCHVNAIGATLKLPSAFEDEIELWFANFSRYLL